MSPLLQVLQRFASTLSPIQSTYLELKAADVRFRPVLPSPTRILGHTVLEYLTSSGLCHFTTPDAVVDVPLLDALHQVLAFPEVQADLTKVKPSPGTINDISRGLPAGLWRFKYVAANLMAYEIFLETEKQHSLKPAATAIATSQQLPAPAQPTPPPRNTIAATHEHIISNTHKRLTGSRGSYPQRESAGGA
jgi:hypothetical protein